MSQLKFLILLSRPILWLGPICIYLLASIAKANPWDLANWLGLIFVTFPMGLIVYGLNDIADQKSDAFNSRKGGIEGLILKQPKVKLIFLAITIVVSFYSGMFLYLHSYYSLFVIWTIIVFACLYSFLPVRLKTRPILDSISNGFWLIAIFLIGYSLKASSLMELLKIPRVIWLIGLGTMIGHALAAVMDYSVDKKAGDTTIAVFLGQRPTIALGALTFSLILLLLRPLDLAIVVYLTAAILLCLIMWFKPTQTLIHHLTWTIALTFPALCTYLIIFELSLVKKLLQIF